MLEKFGGLCVAVTLIVVCWHGPLLYDIGESYLLMFFWKA